MKATKTKPASESSETTAVLDMPVTEPATTEVNNQPLPDPVAALPPVAPTPASSPAIEWRAFKKVSVHLPLYVDKVRVPFEVLGDNVGVIKLNPATDSHTIDGLDKMAKAKVGGVVAVSLEQYESLKKKLPFQTSAPRSPQPNLRVWDSRPKPLLPQTRGSVVAVNSSVASSPRGNATTVGGVAGVAGNSPATFAPNLRRKSDVLKSGVLKVPASGQFRADANIPPPLPPPAQKP